MTRKEALESLLAKVEAGGWCQKSAHNAFGIGRSSRSLSAFNGSLDAAKALHEAVLPWHDYRIEYRTGVPRAIAFTGGTNSLSWSERITNDDPARAWLIAILKALIAQEQE